MMLPMFAPGSHGNAELADGRIQDVVVMVLDPEPVELFSLGPLAEVHDEVDVASALSPP